MYKDVTIEVEKFWNVIEPEVQEYLSMRYYGSTRCLLTKEQKLEISIKEIRFIEKTIIPKK